MIDIDKLIEKYTKNNEICLLPISKNKKVSWRWQHSTLLRDIDDTIIIRTKKEIIEPIFLNLLLVSKIYKDQLLFTGEQGATRQAITKAQLEKLKNYFMSYSSIVISNRRLGGGREIDSRIDK